MSKINETFEAKPTNIDWNPMYVSYALGLLTDEEIAQLAAREGTDMLYCYECNTFKDRKEFGIARCSHNGYKGRCKQCVKNYENTERGKLLRKVRISRRLSKKKELPSTLKADEWQIILDKYENRCAYCGKHASIVGTLQQDHVVPCSRGGGYTVLNIVPACRSCNVRKNARTPDEAGLELKRIPLEQLTLGIDEISR